MGISGGDVWLTVIPAATGLAGAWLGVRATREQTNADRHDQEDVAARLALVSLTSPVEEVRLRALAAEDHASRSDQAEDAKHSRRLPLRSVRHCREPRRLSSSRAAVGRAQPRPCPS